MEYEVIVLGATFTAAGLLQKHGEKCLVLERRPQAGYEWINALNFGTDYENGVESEAAKRLYEVFCAKGAFSENRINLFDCASNFYQLLEGKSVMLNMELVSVEKEGDSFVVLAHGVSGYRRYRGKQVIDTRVHAHMIESKAIHMLINSERDVAVSLPEGVCCETWGYDGDLILKCPVSKDADYMEGRKAVLRCMEQLPEAFRTVYVADCFAHELIPGYPVMRDGILYMPSCAYNNPLQAFDAGVKYAGGDL